METRPYCTFYNWGGTHGHPSYPREYGARCEKHGVFFSEKDGEITPNCEKCANFLDFDGTACYSVARGEYGH